MNSSTSTSLSMCFCRRCCLHCSAVCCCRFLVPKLIGECTMRMNTGRATLSRSVDVLHFKFNATEPLGQSVVNCSENNEEDEADNAEKDWPKKINDPDDVEPLAAENNHRNPGKRVNETHQEIERSHYLAGLENGDADQLLCH